MFYELLSNTPFPLTDLSLFPTIDKRNAWEGLDPEWKREALTLGEKYLSFDYPHLSATDFLAFTRTGNRVSYEDKLFCKRHALNALVLAECVEDKGRFMDDIINGIFSICEESGWQLPAHNSYVRDTPQLPLPDAAAPVLDLFACETGAILGTVSYLLGSRLDAISPVITGRIFQELSHRIFLPYLNCHFWWMGNGREPMNNWTIWCTQNVLLSVFFTATDEVLRRRVLEKACKSADYFLAEYQEDGCCDEGAQYYRHAGLCLFNTIEILNAVSNGHFSSLYELPKIKNIASYILNVHVDDIYYVNFADCSPVAGRAGVREYLFARRTGNTAMADFAARDFVCGKKASLLLKEENNLFYRLQNAFTVKELRAYAKTVTKAPLHPDIFYPSTGVFLTRDKSLLLAVKAGGNADSHNHNDTGSFIIYKNGLPLVIDVGVESYTKKTFSDRRYEIWTMQSAYHNLPTINGIMQKDGKEYCASHVTHSFSDKESHIQMDISTAYPKAAGLSYYLRSAALIKGEKIVIHDSFQSVPETASPEGTVILSLMFYEKPVLHGCEAAPSFSIGTLGTLSIEGGSFLKLETIPITDARLKNAWKHEIYRVLISASANELTLTIT